jgi:hypothetical protein
MQTLGNQTFVNATSATGELRRAIAVLDGGDKFG